jgi:hypothetical protein
MGIRWCRIRQIWKPTASRLKERWEHQVLHKMPLVIGFRRKESGVNEDQDAGVLIGGNPALSWAVTAVIFLAT